jgi:hypothetical protein
LDALRRDGLRLYVLMRLGFLEADYDWRLPAVIFFFFMIFITFLILMNFVERVLLNLVLTKKS